MSKSNNQLNSIVGSEVIDQITARALACARIRVDAKDVETTVKKLFSYVSMFNSLDVYETQTLSRKLEDIEIISELVPFIIPRSVRLTISDINSKDLLVRTNKDVALSTAYSYDDFMNAQIKFRGYFKKDVRTETTRLSDLKVDESLLNVLPRIAVKVDNELRVRYLNDAFVPLLLVDEVGFLHRAQYYNATANDVLTDYLVSAIY